MQNLNFAFIPGTKSIRIYKEGGCVSTISFYNEETKHPAVQGGKIHEFYHVENSVRQEVKKHTSNILGFIQLNNKSGIIRRTITQHYELLPREIQREISKTGIHLTGKVFRLKGFAEYINEIIPVSSLSYSTNRVYLEEGIIRLQKQPEKYEKYMLR